MHITIERKTTVYNVAIVLYALAIGSLQAASADGWTYEKRKIIKDRIEFDKLIEYFGLKEKDYQEEAAMEKKRNELLTEHCKDMQEEEATEKEKENRLKAALLADILLTYSSKEENEDTWTAFIDYDYKPLLQLFKPRPIPQYYSDNPTAGFSFAEMVSSLLFLLSCVVVFVSSILVPIAVKWFIKQFFIYLVQLFYDSVLPEDNPNPLERSFTSYNSDPESFNKTPNKPHVPPNKKKERTPFAWRFFYMIIALLILGWLFFKRFA